MGNELHRAERKGASQKPLLLVPAALLAALLTWWVWPAGRPQGAAARPEQGTEVAGAGPSVELVAGAPEPIEVGAAGGSAEAPEDAERAAVGREGGARAAEPALVVSFAGRLVDPLRQPLAPASTTLVLVPAPGAKLSAAPRTTTVRAATEVLVEELPPGRWLARVSAPGHRHAEQVFELSPAGDPAGTSTVGARTVLRFEERLVLWPESFVAVRLETPRGEPFEILAEELGLEPESLFVGAFDVRARLDPPDDAAWSAWERAEEAEPPARFAPPPGYKSWRLPGACIGSLRLHAPPPMWVGLAVHGVPLGWELLAPGEQEVAFRLDADALLARLSSLALRVVAAETGAPLPGARVTLRAEVSAHRRAEHAKVAPDPDGRVRLERIVPGEYDLEVGTATTLHQERVRVPPGQALEHPDVALAYGAGLLVRVEGAPSSTITFLEVAPYERGGRTEELYPPSLWRSADERGEHLLPLPSAPSIVRATVLDVEHHREVARSRDVVVDPAAPPPGPLVLAVQRLVDVDFEAFPAEAAVIEVLDDQELVLAAIVPERGVADDTDLVPGAYRARALDGAGRVLAEAHFVVGDEPLRVPLH